MRRAAIALAGLGSFVLACNALLGIDADVKDPPAPDAGPTIVVQADGEAKLKLEATPPAELLQDGRLTLSVVATRVDASDTRPIEVFCTTAKAKVLRENTTRITVTSGVPGTFDVAIDRMALLGPLDLRIEAEGVNLTFTVDVRGAIDTSFGAGGVVGIPGIVRPTPAGALETPSGKVVSIEDDVDVGLVVLSDDSIVVAFGEKKGNVALYRLDAEGVPMTSFGVDGLLTLTSDEGAARDVVRLEDDLLIVGDNAQTNKLDNPLALRISSDGGRVDTAPPAVVKDSIVRTRAALTEGTGAWMAGTAVSEAGVTSGFLYVLDGGAWTPLASPPMETRALLATGDTLTLIGATLDSTKSGVVRRLLRDGGPDPAFPSDASALPASEARAAAAGTAGGLVVAGSVGDRPALVAIDQAGAAATQFSDGGILRSPRTDPGAFRALARMDDGTLIAVGYIDPRKDGDRTGLAVALSPDGAIKPRFGIDGVALTGTGNPHEFRRLARQRDKLIAAGVEEIDDVLRVFLVRLIP